MDHLHLMPKLKQHVDAVNTSGGNVQVQRFGPGVFAGRAEAPDKVIISFRGLAGNPVDDAESEFQAFRNSLEECRKLAQGGDKGLLRTALHFIGQRQTSGKEPAHYQAALDRIVADALWGESQADAQ